MIEITNEHRARVYKELLSDDFDMNTAMLLAASKIPPEYENGGVEISAIKLFREMLKAAAAAKNVAMPLA